jgi:hypothetical protein
MDSDQSRRETDRPTHGKRMSSSTSSVSDEKISPEAPLPTSSRSLRRIFAFVTGQTLDEEFQNISSDTADTARDFFRKEMFEDADPKNKWSIIRANAKSIDKIMVRASLGAVRIADLPQPSILSRKLQHATRPPPIITTVHRIAQHSHIPMAQYAYIVFTSMTPFHYVDFA